MPERRHERVPISIHVAFRNDSSLLVAYSINLSRGGMFVETDHPAPVGSDVSLEVSVPGAGVAQVSATVSWRREFDGLDGPKGLGLEFTDDFDPLGAFVDQLVSDYAGMEIVIGAIAEKDQLGIGRVVQSILTSASVVTADLDRADSKLTSATSLLIVSGDKQPTAVLQVIALASGREPPVPCVLLTRDDQLRERVKPFGCDTADVRAPAEQLRRLLLDAISRPAAIR